MPDPAAETAGGSEAPSTAATTNAELQAQGEQSESATPPPNRELQLPAMGAIVGGRYQIGPVLERRDAFLRMKGVDLGSGRGQPLPVVILREPCAAEPPPSPTSLSDLMPSPVDPQEALLGDTKIDDSPVWPSVNWEKRLLSRTPHLSVPRVYDVFSENGFEYLIEEVPAGQPFWDAWEDPSLSWSQRCAWLIQIAEALEELHGAGATLDSLRPDVIVVTATSQATITDLSGLLPIPVPAVAPVYYSLYSAPEIVLGNGRADARADLFGFGAMVQALLLGRELTDLDFHRNGCPRHYLERFPDGHPMLGRLLSRTFEPDVDLRFPSHDHRLKDPTGFRELIAMLRACGRALDAVRLDIAAWSNTGVVRSSNEDAVAILHSMEARLEDSDDFAIVVLADGMGGMASGEVASALTVQTIRDFFLRHPPLTELHVVNEADTAPMEPESSDFHDLIVQSLREANQVVYDLSRQNELHRGMGCTAEVVLIDGKKAYIGHVGDSRCYHLRQGKLTQITQDQTLVSQLVALGQLTHEEAETHPQRSELQQAMGGRRDVYPDRYFALLAPGDWLIVCSDGLSNQLKNPDIVSIIQGAGSAEKAARRLVNQAIIEGAFDNVTVVVVRAC